MLQRRELKFPLSFAQYATVREAITSALESDDHSSTSGRYPVLSRYYDTPDLKMFYEKVNGEFEHVKIRLRKYDTDLLSPGTIFLEAKVKMHDRQEKIRIPGPCHPEILDPMQWRNSFPAPQGQADFFERIAIHTPLIPSCGVYYEREAFQGYYENEEYRINFDTHLLALQANETSASCALQRSRSILGPYFAILEIKTRGHKFHNMMVDQLRAAGADQASFSKYGCAVEHLSTIWESKEVVI